MPRLAAYARLPGLKKKKARQLALDYQLITEETSCVLVHERPAGEKATEAPELRKVPQMLAAGWGGAGSVDAMRVREFSQDVMPSVEPAAPAPLFSRADLDFSDSAMEYQQIPAPLRSKSRSPKRFGKGAAIEEDRHQESIDTLSNLPFAVLDCLKANGIQHIADLLALSEEQLKALEGIDEDDVELIMQALKKRGWHLKAS